jgi:hypothetical protein
VIDVLRRSAVISAQAHAKQSCVTRLEAAARARELEAPRMIRAANKTTIQIQKQKQIQKTRTYLITMHQVRTVVNFLVHVGGN